MAEGERQKKTSVTHLVHSTFGLLKPTDLSPVPRSPASPEDDPAVRLAFRSTGSVSSEKAAACEMDSELMTSLDNGARRRRSFLPHQQSQDGSVFSDELEQPMSLQSLCPEVKRMGSDTELIVVHKAMNYADQNIHQKTTKTPSTSSLTQTALRDRSMSLQPSSSAAVKFVSQPISWEEDAVSNNHIFHEVDSREVCYFAESSHCQQAKLFHTAKRQKIRCSACKVLVHETCREKLTADNIHCKETFREIRQKLKDTVVIHHFLQRRKPVGKSKCSKCEKGFGNWKFMTGRDVVAVSCSWCGDSYHTSCFSPRLKEEPCHMGPLRRLIIKSSWIVRVPNLDRGDESPKPFSVTRRKTRRSRRKKLESRPSKYFKVKAVTKQQKPLLVFINPKSGGNQGAKLLQTFQWLLNPRQVFDLSRGSPMFGLKMFGDLGDLRILACGGDGTVGWVLSIIDELAIKPFPPVAILPLGTGNDLSRVLGWGAGYSDEPLDKILMHVDEGPSIPLDRWLINVWPNEEALRGAPEDKDSVPDVPIHVVNNYFSVGADAQVALEFHLGREANPEKFNNRIKNKFFYTKMGGKDILQRKFADLTDHITLIGDGVDLTPRIRAQRLEAICFLNIPSHGAGTNPWGIPPSRDPKIGPQFIDDGHIEVVGFWASTFAKLQVGMSHGERIAQCEHIKMYTTKALPVQIDGEACKLQPSIIEVIQKNTAQMIRKVARKNVETPLGGVAPTEKIKMSVSKVTREQYEKLKKDVQELRRVATPLGLIMTSVEDSLDIVRKEVEKFVVPDDDDGSTLLSFNWRFLETNSGPFESMFRVLPDQEHTMTIGNMPSDGIIVVENDSLPPQTNMTKIFSPGEDMEGHPLENAHMCSDDVRGQIGRTHSYRRATSPSCDMCPLPPPRVFSVSVSNSAALKVPNSTNQKRGSIGSNQSEEGYEGDAENLSPSPLQHIDMGSDSTGGETDTCPVPDKQKALFDAVKRGQVDKILQCHEAGVELTATDANGWTALHHAARHGRLEVVKYLVANLPRQALDLVEDEKLQTALHKAAWYGYVHICSTLVDAGASVLRIDYRGYTVVAQATHHGDKELIRYLKSKEIEQQKVFDQEEQAV